MRIRFEIFPGLVWLSLCAALTGCGVYEGTATNTIPMAEISGKVHGGQQPIVGAKVYLYAAGAMTAGNAGYGSGATSLLNSPGYVTTAADGSFSLTGAYSLSACQSADQQVYLVAVGGNPGAGDNANAVLMSALGDCNNFNTSSYVWINEVTTVASVVALQQFMTPGTYNVGTSLTNARGLRNAFLTVPNLVSLSTGTALASTPNGNGTVPQDEINYLANILAACVNSTTGSAQCSSLFTDATPPGGTAPTDTLGAMLDIALNPGNNVSALYLLPPPAVAFPTTLAQPNDWTIAVKYTGGGLASPHAVAVDKNGNVWASNYTSSVLSGFTTAGVSLLGSTGTAMTGVSSGDAIAITPSGTIWTAGGGSTSIDYFTSAGAYGGSYTWGCYPLGISSDSSGNIWGGNVNGHSVCKLTSGGSSFSYTVSNYAGATAIDKSGNIWAPGASASANTVYEFTSSGSLVGNEPSTGWSDPANVAAYSVAIDAQGDVWMPSYIRTAPGLITEVSSAGAVLSGSGYTGPTYLRGIAIDGANTVWATGELGGLSHYSISGSLISPAAGYSSPLTNGEFAMAIDGSGNVWTGDSGNALIEWVGVAAPVATPLAQNLVNSPTTIGQRP
jgi:hypothetical protein